MKEFFKMVFATVVGILIFMLIFGILGMISPSICDFPPAHFRTGFV